jgi:hypothetical protein
VHAGILSGVAHRAKAPEYARLLGDCRALYCEARLGLVAPITRARIAALTPQPLPALTRAGCAYLMQVSCTGGISVALVWDAAANHLRQG